MATFFFALRLLSCIIHSRFIESTDHSIVSGGRNSVKITSGIGDLSKDVRAFVAATQRDLSMGEMIHNLDSDYAIKEARY